MQRFKPHIEILPDPQKNLWPHLNGATELGFTLYGGTAIALQLGHRVSIDFDFFSDKDIDFEKLKFNLPFIEKSIATKISKNTYSVKTEDGVKLSFFGGIDFGRVGNPIMTNDEVLQVASLDDLMATKLKVVLQRAELKDYLDISNMLEYGVSLEKGLSAARSMFGPNFQPSESLRALTYFEDGDLKKLKDKDKKIIISAVNNVRKLEPVDILSNQLSIENHTKSIKHRNKFKI